MVWLGTLVSATLLGAACASSAGDADETAGAQEPVPVLTQRHDGRTLALRIGATATLRVRAEGAVEVEGRSVQLVQVDYLADPGFREWELHAGRAGTTVIRGPRTSGGRFRITIRVTAG